CLGALYLGRVRTMVPALDAAFVDLGEKEDGFLPVAAKNAARKIREGDALAVEVVRDAEDGKGPRLARRPAEDAAAIAAGPAPRLLRPAPPLAIRVARDWPGPIRRIVVDDVDTLLALKAWCRDHRPALMEIIARHAPAGDILETDGLADRLEDLLAPWVALPSGGRINIAPTPALIAVDVDSGRDAGAGSPVETARRVNREAALEVARQIRLRGLSGLIVVGFLPMRPAAHRAEVLNVLKRATAGDPCGVNVGGFTRFGLVEMTRARSPKTAAGNAPKDAS
ncbi:MAG: ribonuclease E/G, partial [Pseudomonadota bacterium]